MGRGDAHHSIHVHGGALAGHVSALCKSRVLPLELAGGETGGGYPEGTDGVTGLERRARRRKGRDGEGRDEGLGSEGPGGGGAWGWDRGADLEDPGATPRGGIC